MFGTSIIVVVAALLPLVTPMGAIRGGGPDPSNNTLRFEQFTVFKYEGNQPYDVVTEVVDIDGNPATGADVRIIFAALSKEDIPLKEMKPGVYIGCDVETLDMASGDLRINVAAAKKGYISAVESTNDQRGNACGAGEPQAYITKVEAAKPNGANQPLDVFVYLSDESGRPVKGARVMARATDFILHVDRPLKDLGDGRYLGCSIGKFSTVGPGQISLHVSASAAGYRSTEADTVNSVGRLCSRPSDIPPPLASARDANPAGEGTTTPTTSTADGRYVR